MLISHEVPTSLLKESRKFNNYDYALVHLFETNTEYLDFFRESLDMGRMVILDNSCFELGQSFDPDRFAYWIDELRPTEYIIPDVFDDCDATLKHMMNWKKTYNLPGLSIGTVHGKTVDEALECYSIMSKNVDKMAISFGCAFYNGTVDVGSIDLERALGRFNFINTLLYNDLINLNQPHHLLGCSFAAEMAYYAHPMYKFIKSMDSSNPTVFAINTLLYSENGMDRKIRTKLVDYMDVKDVDLDILYDNVNKFRGYVRDIL